MINREHLTEFMIVCLRAGNTGMRKTSVTGLMNSILETGKATTGSSSTGLILRIMMKRSLKTGMSATGRTGPTGSKICLMNAWKKNMKR